MRYSKEIETKNLLTRVDAMVNERIALATKIEELNRYIATLAPKPNFERQLKGRLHGVTRTEKLGATMDTVANHA